MSEVFPKITRLNADEFGGGFNVDSDEGISLRDYFAAKAMQALISGPNTNVTVNGEITSDKGPLSVMAYQYADAMLESRDK